jgi:hypothetical protein
LRHLLCGCIAALVLSAPLAAQASEIYNCTIRQDAANGNWIAEQIVADYDAAKGEVVIFDPIIKHFAGAPLKGKVEAANDKRLTFTWRLDGAESRVGEDANFIYRLTIIKKNNNASVVAQALNYAGPFSASGKCKLVAQ